MARYESKSVSVAPADEQEAIQKHEQFGWELKSSQEIHSQDSHLESRGDEIWNVTTTTNYVKLVFQRDMDMPNIAAVRKVEEEYWPAYSTSKRFPAGLSLKAKILTPLVCMLPGLGTSNGALLVIGLAVGIAALILYGRFIQAPKEHAWAQARSRCQELEEQLPALFAPAVKENG